MDIHPGHSVLDVATGTGNIAIRAAAAGAQVVGLDLTPELFETARARAAAAGVIVDWVEGDAEELPYKDEVVRPRLSAFGVQFAPRHQIVAQELAGVTRQGGRIGLVNWTPEGLIGQLFKIMGAYMPAPPAFASPPPLWGSESHVRNLFRETPVVLEFARGTNPWRFESAGGLGLVHGDRLRPDRQGAGEAHRRGPLGGLPRGHARAGRAQQRGDGRQPAHGGRVPDHHRPQGRLSRFKATGS